MKEKMTTVLLPRGRKQEENFVIVSVNGRSWKIMRGVEVRVPVCVAEELETAAMMAEAARRFAQTFGARHIQVPGGDQRLSGPGMPQLVVREALEFYLAP